MSARNGPGRSNAGPVAGDRRTAESTDATQAHLHVATAERKARARRVEQMERAVTDARRCGDAGSVRLLTALLEVEYERRSYVRVVDPTIVRYRRLLCGAA